MHSLFTEVNATACTLFGCSRSELLSLTLADVTAPLPLPTFAINEIRKSGQTLCEHRIQTRDGQMTPVEISTQTVKTGTDTAMVTIIRDISDRKRMEQELAQAKTTVQTAEEIKGQFLANMSHELRTPLNGIMGMTQILLNSDLAPNLKEYLGLSLEAARQLNKVVTDLLALSHIQSGNLDPSPTDFNLHETLRAITKPMALQAAKKSLRLNLDIAPNIPTTLNGDAGKLRQILINLLLNSIKFTEDGNISLSVECQHPHNKVDTFTKVSFTVSDTGIGILPDQQKSIFKSFSQAEDYMTKQYGGTGLGLSISRQLADIMDGTITLKSTPGKGSDFTLTLPLLVKSQPATPSGKKTSTPVTTGPLKILLAEDEQVNSIMASRLLKNAGHTVTVAGNGQQALDLLSNNPYDLVLMDVQMPVLNGLQATEIIRSGAAENIPHDLPVIGLTAYARKKERQRFLEAGMHSIVTKPYEAEELMQAITKAMTEQTVL